METEGRQPDIMDMISVGSHVLLVFLLREVSIEIISLSAFICFFSLQIA